MIKEVKNIEKLAERFVRRKILSSKKMVSPKIFIRVFTELKGGFRHEYSHTMEINLSS